MKYGHYVLLAALLATACTAVNHKPSNSNIYLKVKTPPAEFAKNTATTYNAQSIDKKFAEISPETAVLIAHGFVGKSSKIRKAAKLTTISEALDELRLTSSSKNINTIKESCYIVYFDGAGGMLAPDPRDKNSKLHSRSTVIIRKSDGLLLHGVAHN